MQQVLIKSRVCRRWREPWSQLRARTQMVALTPTPLHWRNRGALLAGTAPLQGWWGEEERKTKPSSIFKAAASLHRGPGWRCKPARLIETKLQVQREVIRKPPSGSTLPFKFHLIKPKEKKALSLLPPSLEHSSLRAGPPHLPSFLLTQPGRKHTPARTTHPRSVSSLKTTMVWIAFSSPRGSLIPSQLRTPTPRTPMEPATDG